MSRAAGITAQNYEVEGCARLGVERMTGIEPACSAWKADVLPLHHVRRSRPCIEAGNSEGLPVCSRLPRKHRAVSPIRASCGVFGHVGCRAARYKKEDYSMNPG